MIIELSGKKGSGKTTIANYLQSTFESEECSVEIVGFADFLKEIVTKLFISPLDDIDLDTTEGKTAIISSVGILGRELLQDFGSACRKIYPDCFVNALQYNPAFCAKDNTSAIVIIDDVRYENELELELPPHTTRSIRLTRCLYVDPHESETALDYLVNETEAWLGGYNTTVICDPIKLHFDAIIRNEAMTIDQQCSEAEKLIEGWLAI